MQVIKEDKDTQGLGGFLFISRLYTSTELVKSTRVPNYQLQEPVSFPTPSLLSTVIVKSSYLILKIVRNYIAPPIQ